jgi:hypothetical protein
MHGPSVPSQTAYISLMPSTKALSSQPGSDRPTFAPIDQTAPQSNARLFDEEIGKGAYRKRDSQDYKKHDADTHVAPEHLAGEKARRIVVQSVN